MINYISIDDSVDGQPGVIGFESIFMRVEIRVTQAVPGISSNITCIICVRKFNFNE